MQYLPWCNAPTILWGFNTGCQERASSWTCSQIQHVAPDTLSICILAAYCIGLFHCPFNMLLVEDQIVSCWHAPPLWQAELWVDRQTKHSGTVWVIASHLLWAWIVHWELQTCTNTLQISASVRTAMSSAILTPAYPMQWVGMIKRVRRWQMKSSRSVRTSLWMHWEAAADLALNILLLSGIFLSPSQSDQSKFQM